MPDSSLPPRRRRSLATWVAAISLVALLPLLVFATTVVYRNLAEEQQRARQALESRSANAAQAVAHEIGSLRDELRTLAQADGFRRGDTALMHGMASRVVDQDRRLSAISMTDVEGTLLFTTLQALHTPLPRSNLTAQQRPLFEHGEVLVSPLITGAVSGLRVIVVAIPVQIGTQRLALRATMRLATINGVLERQRWPEGWVAAVIDQKGVVIGRSRDADRFVGQSVTASLRPWLSGGESIVEATSLSGIPTVAGLAPVPGTGWWVTVGLPKSTFNAQVRESLVQMLAGGLLCALLGIGASVYFARYLRRHLQAMVDSLTRADGSGPAPSSGIREVDALGQALWGARAQVRQALAQLEQARRDAEARLDERSEMLNVLAHEVRQPLHNASAALQAATAAQGAGGDAGTARQALGRANAVISEVQANINNTLAAASLLVGAEAIWQDDTDIDALIAVAIADLPPRAVTRVHVERATATRTATMNASLMRLALRNLMSNALKYSPPDSAVTVRLSDSDEPLALLIDVIDQGGGIADDLIPALFERTEPTRREPGDAPPRRKGLGLHIVRRVMELHGGMVQVLRHGRDGTTMRLVIMQGQAD